MTEENVTQEPTHEAVKSPEGAVSLEHGMAVYLGPLKYGSGVQLISGAVAGDEWVIVSPNSFPLAYVVPAREVDQVADPLASVSANDLAKALTEPATRFVKPADRDQFANLLSDHANTLDPKRRLAKLQSVFALADAVAAAAFRSAYADARREVDEVDPVIPTREHPALMGETKRASLFGLARTFRTALGSAETDAAFLALEGWVDATRDEAYETGRDDGSEDGRAGEREQWTAKAPAGGDAVGLGPHLENEIRRVLENHRNALSDYQRETYARTLLAYVAKLLARAEPMVGSTVAADLRPVALNAAALERIKDAVNFAQHAAFNGSKEERGAKARRLLEVQILETAQSHYDAGVAAARADLAADPPAEPTAERTPFEIYCPGCRVVNRYPGGFAPGLCGNCGLNIAGALRRPPTPAADLVDGTFRAPAPAVKTCPSCELATVDATFPFCPHCGYFFRIEGSAPAPAPTVEEATRTLRDAIGDHLVDAVLYGVETLKQRYRVDKGDEPVAPAPDPTVDGEFHRCEACGAQHRIPAGEIKSSCWRCGVPVYRPHPTNAERIKRARELVAEKGWDFGWVDDMAGDATKPTATDPESEPVGFHLDNWDIGAAERATEAAPETDPVRTCRQCGCTELDCQTCLERTGAPCHWVEPDLCSACKEFATELGAAMDAAMSDEDDETVDAGSLAVRLTATGLTIAGDAVAVASVLLDLLEDGPAGLPIIALVRTFQGEHGRRRRPGIGFDRPGFMTGL